MRRTSPYARQMLSATVTWFLWFVAHVYTWHALEKDYGPRFPLDGPWWVSPLLVGEFLAAAWVCAGLWHWIGRRQGLGDYWEGI